MSASREEIASLPLGDVKCVIILDADLPVGLLANTAAVLSLSLGKYFPIIGEDIRDGSDRVHAGLTMIPVPILKSTASDVLALWQAAQEASDAVVVDVTDAAQTTKNYDDYRAKLGASSTEALRYLGIAIYGKRKTVNALTGRLGLLR